MTRLQKPHRRCVRFPAVLTWAFVVHGTPAAAAVPTEKRQETAHLSGRVPPCDGASVRHTVSRIVIRF
jgi:hypothetical protein